MASTWARNALRRSGGMLPRTVAYGSDSRNRFLILLGVVLSCVINGDTVSGMLRQATWLVVAVIVLVVIQILDDSLGSRIRSGRATLSGCGTRGGVTALSP